MNIVIIAGNTYILSDYYIRGGHSMFENYEFAGASTETSSEIQQKENNETSFLDFYEGNKQKKTKVNKLVKKANKPVEKKLKKQGKKIKRIESRFDELSNKVDLVQADVVKMKKSSYKDMLYKLAESDSAILRKKILSEILSVEDAK